MRIDTFAGLRVRLFGGANDDGVGDGPLVVLLHGMTAPAEQLVPLALAVASPRRRVAVPEGPFLLEGFAGGLSWWEVNIGKQIRLRAKKLPSELREASPRGLPAARELVARLIGELCARLGDGPIVLGGFSQGAMLAMDVALRGGVAIAAVALVSGTILDEAAWRPLLPRLAGMDVSMTHARQDDVLRYDTAVDLRELLRAAGARVTWSEHDGTHEVSAEDVRATAGWIVERFG